MEVKFFKDGKLCREEILGKAFFPFFYQSKLGFFFYKILERPFVSKFVGWLANSRWSCRYIKPFIKKFSIVESDFIEPKKGYSSFNEFFIRPLRLGVRSIHMDDATFIAPADSKLLIIPNISCSNSFVIKNNTFTLAEFLGDVPLAQEYEDGSMMIFRLAPYDYHRYHFPVDAEPPFNKDIKGVFGSVNPLAYRFKKQPLVENQRSLIVLETRFFNKYWQFQLGLCLWGLFIIVLFWASRRLRVMKWDIFHMVAQQLCSCVNQM